MSRRRQKPGIVREPATEYASVTRISATEAARSFSDLLNRVSYRGERFLIERSGKVVGELGPAGPTGFKARDLLPLLKSLPEIDHEFLEAVSRVTRNQPTLPESPWER
ncbi:MAG: hypothetical protein R3190_05500 [Thermoanaerobaculia bacterium]|nr:hypothetical protein [Thermoanaerobaculia bacterium]